MPKYTVRPGFTFGASKQHKPGDTVELTEQEAAGFLDKLELAEDTKPSEGSGNVTVGGLIMSPALSNAEKQLEAETGHDVVQTGNEPPTFVETDAPAPGTDSLKGKSKGK